MEYKHYKKGSHVIEATETAFKAIYKAKGFKPCQLTEDTKDGKSRSSNRNKRKNSAD